MRLSSTGPEMPDGKRVVVAWQGEGGGGGSLARTSAAKARPVLDRGGVVNHPQLGSDCPWPRLPPQAPQPLGTARICPPAALSNSQ